MGTGRTGAPRRSSGRTAGRAVPAGIGPDHRRSVPARSPMAGIAGHTGGAGPPIRTGVPGTVGTLAHFTAGAEAGAVR